MCGMKLLIHFQTSTVQSLKFVTGKVISPYTLLGIWVHIHARIEVKPCQWKGPQGSQYFLYQFCTNSILYTFWINPFTVHQVA